MSELIAAWEESQEVGLGWGLTTVDLWSLSAVSFPEVGEDQ